MNKTEKVNVDASKSMDPVDITRILLGNRATFEEKQALRCLIIRLKSLEEEVEKLKKELETKARY